MEITITCRGGLEPQDQAEVQGCPRDPLLLNPHPSQSLPFSSALIAIHLCGKAALVPSIPSTASCGHPERWFLTSRKKQEQEDGTRQEESNRTWARDERHGAGRGQAWGKHDTYQETARWRLPCPRSQTGFGQSAGDLKPFLRHKGHGNKMPVRRRGSAVSTKRGLRVLVCDTPGASCGGLQHRSAVLEGKNNQLSKVMLGMGLLALETSEGQSTSPRARRCRLKSCRLPGFSPSCR